MLARQAAGLNRYPAGQAGAPRQPAWALVGVWLERRRQRRALLELSDHLLKDIGISRVDAWQEARKPFWRP